MDCLSLEEIINLLYFTGLTTCLAWDDCFRTIRPNVMKQDNSDLFNLYVNLFNIIRKIKTGLELTLLNSDEQLELLDTYHFNIADIYTYLNSHVDGFKEKKILKKNFSILHTYVKNYLHPTDDQMLIEKDDDETVIIDDTDTDTEDELDKIFSNIKTSKTNKQLIFEQLVSLNAHGKKRTLKTPGEKGSYLIKIEITDTKDLKGVSNSDRWMKAAYRAIFLVDSKKDQNYVLARKVVLNTLSNLSKLKDVTKT